MWFSKLGFFENPFYKRAVLFGDPKKEPQVQGERKEYEEIRGSGFKGVPTVQGLWFKDFGLRHQQGYSLGFQDLGLL